MGKVHRNSLKRGHKLHWYEIKEILGQGGFGITYLARDTNLDEDVAIKEYLPIELAVREGDFSVHPMSEDHDKNFSWGLKRFIAEARTLTKFKHPNIVRVRNIFEDNNTAYMVMEYEEGKSLSEIISGRKTMEEAELLNIIIPILGGLELVHQQNFIHRDIKPANIYIRTDGSPVLLDFGSARQALGVETKTLTSLVSPGFAPYEQYFSKSDEQGPWTDIYGLGATMYRAITGVAPIDAVDRSKAFLEASHDTMISAADIGKGKYSERFLHAIDHAIQFKHKDRPQNINDWRREFDANEDIDAFNRQRAFEEQLTQPGTRAVRPEKKWHIKYVFAAGLALILILAIGVHFLFNTELQDNKIPSVIVKDEPLPPTPIAEKSPLVHELKQSREEQANVKDDIIEAPVKEIITIAEEAEPAVVDIISEPPPISTPLPAEQKQDTLNHQFTVIASQLQGQSPADQMIFLEQLVNQADIELARASSLYQSNMISFEELQSVEANYQTLQQFLMVNFQQLLGNPDVIDFGSNEFTIGNDVFDTDESLHLDVVGYGINGYLYGEVDADPDTGEVDGFLYDTNNNIIYFDGKLYADGKILGEDENGNFIELNVN